MNLKRLRGIYAVALITIAAALFAGCSNSMAGSVDSGRGMVTLHVSATGIPEEYAAEFDEYCKSVERQRATSRSILPNDPFDIDKVNDNTSQSENLVFVLTGKSETGMKYKATQVFLGNKVTENGVDLGYDFVLDNTNNTPVTMDAMSWALTLTAYKDFTDVDNPGNAVLIGYCSVDLRNGSGDAVFKMGIAGLDTKADVALGGKIIDEDKVAKSYKMGIYRKVDLKDVGSTSSKLNSENGTAGNTEVKYDIADADHAADGSMEFTYEVSGIAPGTYLYTVVFYNKSGCEGNVVGSFTDTIVINPGNTLRNKDLTIDVIGKMPTIPTDLKAQLVANSESADGSTYKVLVTWTESNYVTNYELNLVEYDKDYADGDFVDTADIVGAFATNPADAADLTKGYTEIADGQIYGMASMDDSATKDIKDFPGSTVYGTGNNSSLMMYGDTSCVLTLDTGKLYEIQLRARSYYGVSGWANRISAGTAVGDYDEPANQRINRMLITYNLNGGALVLGTGAQKEYDIHTEYVSWKNNDDLLVIGGTSDNVLKIDDKVDFVEWLLEDGIAANPDDPDTNPDVLVKTLEKSVTKYTYKNVAVKASFGNKVTGNITQDEKTIDIDVKDIYIACGTETNPVATPVKAVGVDGNAFAVPRTNDERSVVVLEIQPTGASTKTIHYNNVKVQVWGQSDVRKTTVSKDAGKTDTNYYFIDTRKYPAGKVYVMVTADTDNAKGVSQTFILDVE